jgi:hypothetical protein
MGWSPKGIPPPKISYGHIGYSAKVVEVVVYLLVPTYFACSPVFTYSLFFSIELGNRPPPPPQVVFSYILYGLQLTVVFK